MIGRLGLLILLLCSACSGCIAPIDEIIPEPHGVPGGLVLACLDGGRFTSMVVEVDHAPGIEPNPSALALLEERLEEVCEKPEGIRIEVQSTAFADAGSWTADRVRTEGRTHRGADAMNGTQLRWHVLYPSGDYEDESVLGVAVDASTVAIFQETVEESEGFLGRPSAEEVERSVLIHEIGHLLGLVNAVYTSPHDHEDPDHPGHSNNDQSVMYWQVESTSVRSFLTGSIPDAFDDEDLDDLERLGDGRLEASDQLWLPAA